MNMEPVEQCLPIVSIFEHLAHIIITSLIVVLSAVKNTNLKRSDNAVHVIHMFMCFLSYGRTYLNRTGLIHIFSRVLRTFC